MKRSALFLIIFITGAFVWAQQKYALVIGNGAYTGISSLSNPVNDANDIGDALQSLGFTVDRVLDGNLDQMELSIMNLRRRLGASQNTYGFFFYAGHGVQSNGENYLIPVDANIQSENHLRQRAVSVQTLLDNLTDAGNELNMIVLDACRDNPFGWSRSGSRGLSVVSRAPSGSIIMYATSANSVASDGSGRNGLFTGQLLNNLKSPGLSVRDIFDRTGEDVLRVSGGRQHPELSLRYFAASSVFLGSGTSVVSQYTAEEHYDRGVGYYLQGMYDASVQEFSEAIKQNSAYTDALVYRGYIYVVQGFYDKSIADFTDAIRLNPYYALAYNNRGWAYNNKREYDRAIADFNEAIRLDPYYAMAYSNRGLAYSRKGDFDRAIADYNEAIKHDPGYTKAYFDRGYAWYDKGDMDRAIADFGEAIKRDPFNADAYINRGLAYHNKGEHDRAIADYTEAIRQDPSNAIAYNNRGWSYREKNDPDRAILDYNEAIRLDPRFALAYNNRGYAYFLKGDYDRTIADCTEAIRHDPNLGYAYSNRGNAYSKKGDNARAEADFARARQLGF